MFIINGVGDNKVTTFFGLGAFEARLGSRSKALLSKVAASWSRGGLVIFKSCDFTIPAYPGLSRPIPAYPGVTRSQLSGSQLGHNLGTESYPGVIPVTTPRVTARVTNLVTARVTTRVTTRVVTVTTLVTTLVVTFVGRRERG